MAESVERKYNCTENQLYVLGGMYVANMTNNLAAFTSHSPRLNAGFVANLVDVIAAGEANPGEAQINIPKMTDRVGLIPSGKFAISDLNKLKSYLISAYPATFKMMYNVAGSGLRAQVSNKNWVQTKALFKAMVDFMAVPAQLARLLADDVMPAGFPAAVAAHQTAFLLDYAAFLADKNTGDQRDAKIAGNNAIKAILSDIGVNADAIFAVGTPTHNLFVFDKQKAIIAPPGSASLKVELILDVAFTKMPGIEVVIQAEGEPAISLDTDAESIAQFNHIDPTRYKVTIAGVGLITNIFYKDVDTGVNARVHVTMELVPPPEVEEDAETEGSGEAAVDKVPAK